MSLPYERLGFKEKQKLLKEMDPMLDIKLVGKNKHRGTIILKKYPTGCEVCGHRDWNKVWQNIN